MKRRQLRLFVLFMSFALILSPERLFWHKRMQGDIQEMMFLCSKR